MQVRRISAVTSGIKEIETIWSCKTKSSLNRQTILFVDEVHV